MTVNRRTLSFIGGGIMILASILFIFSNTLASWSAATFSSIKFTKGLWQDCSFVLNRWVCFDSVCSAMTSSQCTKMMVTRSTLTITCAISMLVVLLFLACLVLGAKATRGLILSIKIIPIVSLVFAILSLVLGISFATSPYGYSVSGAAIWGIIAAVLNMGGVIVAVMI
ncbi:hypothetical protein I4U23_023237 [Adineta vaga]|nr:hypothetical protein I4U23_023237 [Adineta vaga]